MPLYENKICPVCHQPFQEGDDVVFCPECGTPHHRECYRQLNRCANAHLHGSGYSFFKEAGAEEPQNIVEEAKAMLPQKPRENGSGEAEAGGPAYGSFPPFGASAFKNIYEQDTDTIGGESVADVATAVRTNTLRFVTVFKKQEKTGKKASWNWGAFFFGAYYFLYRKMYKQGLLLFLLNMAINYAEGFFVNKLAPLCAKAISDFSEQLAGGKSTPADIMSFTESLQATADYHTYMLIQLVFVALTLLTTLFFTVYADYMYKNTVVRLIKRVNERMDEGEEMPLSVQAQEESMRLTDTELKRMYLAQRGGTAYLPPVLMLLASYFISMVI